ncbi:MAG: hypothetical protein H0U69_08935, partial [Trueperaceae bacterium]|nr:hypothetical protein [Trueperaceae bacterium]
PLFAASGEHPEAIVLTAPERAPARPVQALRPTVDPTVDLAALEVERAERWPGERGRLTNRALRAA